MSDREPSDLEYKDLLSHIRHWIAFIGIRRLAVGTALTIAVVFCGVWLLRSPAPPVETAIPRVSTTSIATTNVAANTSVNGISVPSVTTTPFITVHVAGAVKQPGVYVLPSGARIVDAVRAAGGHTTTADLNAVNLALPIADSEQVFIPKRGEKITSNSTPNHRTGTQTKPNESLVTENQSSAVKSPNSSGVININAATATELEQLPGIGPSIAKAIVTYRSTNGPFVVIDDLMKVSGIGTSKLEALRAYVTV